MMDTFNLGQLTKETVAAEYGHGRHRGLDRFRGIIKDSLEAILRPGPGEAASRLHVMAIVKGGLMGLSLCSRDLALGSVEVLQASRETADALGRSRDALLAAAVAGLVEGRLFMGADVRKAAVFEINQRFPGWGLRFRDQLELAEVEDRRQVQAESVDRYNLAQLTKEVLIQELRKDGGWPNYRSLVVRSLGAAIAGPSGPADLREAVAAIAKGSVMALLVLDLDLQEGLKQYLEAAREASAKLQLQPRLLNGWAVGGFVEARRGLGPEGLRVVRVLLLHEEPGLVAEFDDRLTKAEIPSYEA